MASDCRTNWLIASTSTFQWELIQTLWHACHHILRFLQNKTHLSTVVEVITGHKCLLNLSAFCQKMAGVFFTITS